MPPAEFTSAAADRSEPPAPAGIHQLKVLDVLHPLGASSDRFEAVVFADKDGRLQDEIAAEFARWRSGAVPVVYHKVFDSQALPTDAWRRWKDGRLLDDWSTLGLAKDFQVVWLGEISIAEKDGGQHGRETVRMSAAIRVTAWSLPGEKALTVFELVESGIGFSRAQAGKDLVERLAVRWPAVVPSEVP